MSLQIESCQVQSPFVKRKTKNEKKKFESLKLVMFYYQLHEIFQT